MNRFMTYVRPAVSLFILLSLLTGIVYPLLITGIGQAVFPEQANGSLIAKNGKVIGSSLIGQPFDSVKYFWGRPSATSPYPYNAASSTPSNLGPTNPALLTQIRARVLALRKADPSVKRVPVGLVTASGSGLDPDISPAAAYYQVPRIATARHLSQAAVSKLVQAHITPRQFDVLGEPRVNVLELNLALDQLK